MLDRVSADYCKCEFVTALFYFRGNFDYRYHTGPVLLSFLCKYTKLTLISRFSYFVVRAATHLKDLRLCRQRVDYTTSHEKIHMSYLTCLVHVKSQICLVHLPKFHGGRDVTRTHHLSIRVVRETSQRLRGPNVLRL